MNRERMKELAEDQFIERQKATHIVLTDNSEMIQINQRPYKLILNYRSAFDTTKLAARFSSFLEKYDYLVGDIAADQLRLHGLYADGANGVSRSQQISALEDYLFEEINFGAPYFVLQNMDPHPVVDDEEDEPPTKTRRHNGSRHHNSAAVSEKRTKVTDKPFKEKHGNQKVATKGSKSRRHFSIRERTTE